MGNECIGRVIVEFTRRAYLNNPARVQNHDSVSQSHCLNLVVSHVNHGSSK